MYYPVVIHKDPASDYGVTVPDLPGCFSAGSKIAEAMAMAKEAVSLHIEGLIADGEPVPEPSQLDEIVLNPEFAGGIFAIVEVDDGHEDCPEEWVPLTRDGLDHIIQSNRKRMKDLRDNVKRIQGNIDNITAKHREAIARIDKNLSEPISSAIVDGIKVIQRIPAHGKSYFGVNLAGVDISQLMEVVKGWGFSSEIVQTPFGGKVDLFLLLWHGNIADEPCDFTERWDELVDRGIDSSAVWIARGESKEEYLARGGEIVE